MLRRVDRIVLRVPSVPSAVKYYRDVMGLKLLREDKRLASLRMADADTELVVHADPDLPGEAVYYLVDDVRKLFEQRVELKVQFVQQPAAAARGYRAAIKDPFGNVMLIVDRTAQRGGGGADAGNDVEPAAHIEDGKPAGLLFTGMKPERVGVKKDALVKAYEAVARTADDLPYTPDFERLYANYAAAFGESRPTRQEVWRHLLNLRKGGELPKLGDARSKPPAIDAEARDRLRELVGDEMGKRDRLPYTDKFDRIVDAFNDHNKSRRARPLSPHLVWRLVATLAK